jgi:hypothetical protein|tara:strand:+ start:1837 stop:2319 length:483 start_codon:yes stop_codon:yes gene_type:complete
MRKPTELRKALTAALPELKRNPDRLVIWVEDGAVRTRQTEDASFSFEYPLSVLLREVKTDIAVIVHAINRWLRVNQPDLLAAGNRDSFKFETDILDNGTADIVFTIDLVEAVKVAADPAGGWSLDYVAEPDPLFDDGAALPDAGGTPPLAGATSDTIVAD